LSNALERLGCTVGAAHGQINRRLDPDSADADRIVEQLALEVLAEHDAIQDSPSAFLFEAYDRAFPGSAFILTYRPVEDWLASYSRFFRDENNPLRRWMYGVSRFSGNEAVYREIYESQNARIRAYFAGRPEDFLEMDITAGDGWHKLVTFLGENRLPPFPHSKDSAQPSAKRLPLRRVVDGMIDRLRF
jgi:hypothetical protein